MERYLNSRTSRVSALDSIVLGTSIDHDYFVGPRGRIRHGLCDSLLFVQSGDYDGDGVHTR
jgi:hypothetical protein